MRCEALWAFQSRCQEQVRQGAHTEALACWEGRDGELCEEGFSGRSFETFSSKGRELQLGARRPTMLSEQGCLQGPVMEKAKGEKVLPASHRPEREPDNSPAALR